MNTFDQTLERYGADLAARQLLDEDGPELLPDATLVNARIAGDSDTRSHDRRVRVAEHAANLSRGRRPT